MKNTHLVVMAGGSGTRFWPKSTARRPKQLLSFGGENTPSLLQQTLARFEGVAPAHQQWIVTTELLDQAVRAQAPKAQVLAEPAGRNTAPCVYWAARAIASVDPEAVMLVMPADHHMSDVPAFRKTVENAIALARSQEVLVTLGVQPDRPETGYGYLELGEPLPGALVGKPQQVKRFVEKPGQKTAEEYVSSGRYLWNGGMFIWRASVILAAFDRLMPEMKKVWEEEHGEIPRAYPRLTATSIDYGIMEKATNVVTFPLNCGWDDLGSWTSLETLAQSLGLGREGGVVTGGEMIAIESSGNVVDAPGRCVALLGVSNLIIAENGGALLIADKNRAQDIKKIVDAVKAKRADLV